MKPMFLYLYEVCVVIFLLQGIAAPFLVVLSGILWWKQAQRLESLRKEVDIAGAKTHKPADTIESILDGLPKLKPLNCAHCGGALLLRENETYCPSCRLPGDLPEDYKASVGLKRELKSLLKIAIVRWRIAKFLTSRPARWFFLAMIFVEPLVLFPITLIGSTMFPDTGIDKALESAGKSTAFLMMGCAFFGFVIWMIVFIFLANLSKDLRQSLPAVPPPERPMDGSEAANCQSCGGAIEYGKNDFGCICSYCNVENFRVQFLRQERFQGERQKAKTQSVLFGAMRIIDDFVGTFFFVLLFLVGSAVLYVIGRLILNFFLSHI